MIMPPMPKGYWLLEDGHRWYILQDVGPVLKRLLDSDGHEKLFHRPEAAAEYAQKHKDAGLKYDQEVKL